MAQVTLHKDDDPAIQAATKQAKASFRYFWRELSWEHRRIIPGLDMSAFKVAFTDDENSPAEVMWVSEINFDGYHLTGTLLNQPNWLTSINEGDPVKTPLKGIVDWVYAINETTFGGFTVHAIRSQMSKKERSQHDAAWGLDWGDPENVHLVPAEWYSDEPKKKGFFGIGKSPSPAPLADDFLQSKEHPMAANMAESLKEFASKDPSHVTELADNGLNMLHQLTLAGTAVGAKTMLECGADVNSRSKRGHTALDFAKLLGWRRAYQFLAKNGGKHANSK